MDRKMTAASEAARELGHHWVGSEHLLVALTRTPSTAQAVLEELGVTHERLWDVLQAELARSGRAATKPPRVTANPRLHEVSGCVVGLAAGLGADRAGPEHVLLAIAWCPDSLAAHLLRGVGVDVRQLVVALAARGVAVPAVLRPPTSSAVAWGPRIDVPMRRLMEVVPRRARRLPREAPFGFNHDGQGHAWVVAAEGVDLAAQVRTVLAELERRPRPGHVASGEPRGVRLAPCATCCGIRSQGSGCSTRLPA